MHQALEGRREALWSSLEDVKKREEELRKAEDERRKMVRVRGLRDFVYLGAPFGFGFALPGLCVGLLFLWNWLTVGELNLSPTSRVIAQAVSHVFACLSHTTCRCH